MELWKWKNLWIHEITLSTGESANLYCTIVKFGYDFVKCALCFHVFLKVQFGYFKALTDG